MSISQLHRLTVNCFNSMNKHIKTWHHPPKNLPQQQHPSPCTPRTSQLIFLRKKSLSALNKSKYNISRSLHLLMHQYSIPFIPFPQTQTNLLSQASLTPACLCFFNCCAAAPVIPPIWLPSSALCASLRFSSSIFFNIFSVFCLPLPLPWN
jgi:hypothetical protein